MTTEALIRALASDAATKAKSMKGYSVAAFVPAIAVSVIMFLVFLVALAPRPDMSAGPMSAQIHTDLPPHARLDLPPQPRPDLTQRARPNLPPQARPDLPPQARPPEARPDLPPQPRPDLGPQARLDLPAQSAAVGPAAIAQLASDPRFLFKFVVTLTLAMTALMLGFRLARPGVATKWSERALLIAPMLLVGGVLIELLTVSASFWSAKLIGSNFKLSLIFIPLLAAPLLAAGLLALRHGAPSRPSFAGAVAGLMAGGFGAALYAANSTDDSPLFVATWYSLAVIAVAIIGALLGRKVLRW
jgi:hypothetical protein